MVRPIAHASYVLAADHRRPHLARLLGLATEPGPEHRPVLVVVKDTIAAGFEAAIAAGADPATAGLLIDEEYGAEPARVAIAAGRTVMMPVEASGDDHFRLADPGIVDRVLALGPAWVKALVRYNVDGDPAANSASETALTRLAADLPADGPRLMIEVVVPPTAEQRTRAGTDDAFVLGERPSLIARAVTTLRACGAAPDVWKVEGVDHAADAHAVAEAATSGGARTGLVVLGAGATPARVDTWLRTAARTPGYVGFAVGRSLWWDEIREFLAGRIDRDGAVERIGANFGRAIAVYEAAGAWPVTP